LAKFLDDKDVADNELLQRRCSHRTLSVYTFLTFGDESCFCSHTGKSSSLAISPLHERSVSHQLLECAGWPITSATYIKA
jgi:hypothetical protein